MNKQKKTLFAFDFDLTVVDVNTDYKILDLVAGDVMEDLVYTPKSCWASHIQKVLNRLYRNDISTQNIFDCLKAEQFTPHFKELLESIADRKIIVSNCNTLFIEQILEANQIQVDKVISNIGMINDEDNTIVLKPYHKHDCQRCSVNLCKQKVLQQERNGYDQVIFSGDGPNDYCALEGLREGDIAFVRKGFQLEKLVQANGHELQCQVFYFQDGKDIINQLSAMQII